MTPLEEILINRINKEGPLSVADYMTQCLFHPEHGYYTTTTPIGRSGDFITAPEISQMFGELVGLSLAQAWHDQGRPSPFILAELGPGNGTLMSDILRVCSTVEGLLDAADIHLVEISKSLQDQQAQTLAQYDVTWVSDITKLPQKPLFVIANEFFDCLPIRQFRKTRDGWQEQMIGQQDGVLGFVLGAVAPEITQSDRDFVELSPSALALTGAIARHIGEFGGAALIIDYGAVPPEGDTLQAIKAHEKCSPLHAPGTADLTAHVDFKALIAEAQNHAEVFMPTTQGLFLEQLGITTRAQALAKGKTGAALEKIISQHRRLTHPEEMGTLFKVMGIVPKGAPPLPGLTT